jgi:hypothetical protein
MKWMYVLSMGLTVLSNIAYHFCQKEISERANPLVSLFFTYASGMVLTLICIPVFYPNLQIGESVKSLNWATFGLGFGIVGLELGFLLAYRAGWNLSMGALYSNVMVTIVLLPVGLFFYKEQWSGRNLLGLIFAISGLILMAKKTN